jgi:benzoyl-CoA reductase/2-hydroxyglutaryl-CoA dehydratase subunit BcrC/BadD/HgdB
MLIGSLFSDLNFVDMIEDLGGFVACDDLCCGSRYYESRVNASDDPIEALSLCYLQKPPCPQMKTTKERLTRAQGLIEENKIDGIIYKTIKFCDNHLYDFPAYAEHFHENGIPILQIEDDFKGGNQGQIRTRVEAFIEML